MGAPPDSLVDLITEARQAYHSELRISIDQGRPPVVRNLSADVYLWEEEPASALGRTLTNAMLQLLGHPDGLGVHMSVLRAEAEVATMCRKSHRIAAGHQWPDGSHRALCAELYRGAIMHRSNLPTLIASTGVNRPDSLRRFLARACRHAWEVRREWLIQAVRLQRMDDQSRMVS